LSVRAPALAALLLAVAGCNEGARAPFSIELVTPGAGNPVAGASTGRLRVLVAQDGQPTRDQGVDLLGGTFQLDVAIASYGVPTRIGAELVTDGVTSIGAVPSFAPIGFGFVRIPVARVGTCASLATQRLATPRSGAALVSVEALLAVVGGLGTGATPASAVERFWAPLLTASEGSGPDLGVDLSVGAARAVRFLGQERVLVVSSTRTFVLDFEPDSGSVIVELTGLHDGVGAGSAIADLGMSGLALVGGARGSDAVASVSWLNVDQSVTTSALPSGRRDARAVAWSASEGVLVAGGNEPGEPTFLYVPATAASRESTLAFGPEDEPTLALRGGALLRSADGSAALYVGGLDESGVVTRETWLVTGCPADCTVTAGPAWEAPRERMAVAQTSTAGWLVGGRDASGPSARVERVVFRGTTASLETASLATAREDAAITPLAGGLVLIAGGRGADRALDEFELCAPSSLGPI